MQKVKELNTILREKETWIAQHELKEIKCACVYEVQIKANDLIEVYDMNNFIRS